MTTPAPPDSPQSAEGQADANPWAAPVPGQGEAPEQDGAAAPAPAPAPGEVPGGPYWQPYPALAPQPRNGLGIAAMVLGIVGALFGLAVILFWLAWLPSLLAVIFGGIGLSYARRGLATNRGMALAGVLLGVAGLLVSAGTGTFFAVRVHQVNEDRRAYEKAEHIRVEAAREQAAKERQQFEAAQAKERERQEAEQAKKAADEKARHLGFGESYTYEDGLKVTMAKPVPYVPSGGSGDIPDNTRIVEVRITVVNTGSEELSLYGSGAPFVKNTKGNLIYHVIDGSGRMKFIANDVAPGQDSSSVSAYALPNNGADPFYVEFHYGKGMNSKTVTWTGSAG
ncbi:DUF4190 domain-containing protein [Kitasatospora sp. NPDC101801]|uniref:DUF4190 domain-containing protein n=1 Tax=Kitasatospora sp. NPDC101801 TaxID=3364103 RepID=UPI0038240E55